ncbi:hypothetical protein FRACYDRAFT_168549 [Fragilariopsis cylindrus CCMP1102]|uniref:Mitochondrial import inner membrane translocase subunit TIM16 n=1 Tax=Fragilariopsis cylindrus CCMP1102 TaxID=635003 RepID=A0A1E7FLM1_9STRA|nr:hypothetical protein FRACYDRAFT_168549 [Fragilariopsis cylindrus CCMP1102]|eukprot:OEU19068.1 hypothetical protein FRACYDRAFT_168549 [Fragilariopsis cylindrus CCMP1102]
MAIGPFARILAQIVVPVIAVLARAIPAAYSQALNNAKKAGVDASEAAVPVFGKRISKSEALTILNLTEKEITTDPKIIKKQFDRYFAANASSNKGGSFYLQSKIYRANELLQEFQTEKHKEDIAGKKNGANGDKG